MTSYANAKKSGFPVSLTQDLSIKSKSGPNLRVRKNMECESGKSLFIIINVC